MKPCANISYLAGRIPAIVVALVVLAGSARAAVDHILYSFTGGSDGAYQNANVIADAAGNLYGTTMGGGVNSCGVGCGTVFQLVPPEQKGGAWSEKTLYTFQGGSGYDGWWPDAPLVFDASGNLYSTTYRGGAYNQGVVFQLMPPQQPGGAWTETVIYSFRGGEDGAHSIQPVIFGPDGFLYGVTLSGGAECNCGVVFSLEPPTQPGGTWTPRVLYRFRAKPDGSQPADGGLLASGRNLYGTTSFGGQANHGTVFELSPPAQKGAPWTETVLYSFKGGSDGQHPDSVLMDKDGNLYGTTQGPEDRNGGTVFELSPPTQNGGPWTETVLHNFQGGSDGAYPTGLLRTNSDGDLYGTTFAGGVYDGGTLFRVSPPTQEGDPWTEVVLHAFGSRYGHDGSQPAGIILRTGGIIYGSTYFGGGPAGAGTVFSVQ